MSASKPGVKTLGCAHCPLYIALSQTRGLVAKAVASHKAFFFLIWADALWKSFAKTSM
jgi:hypothetical protein